MGQEAKCPPSSASPRSSKRPRSLSSPSSAEKKRRLSSNDGTIRDSTLRIVTEMLRDENRQLVQDRDILEKENKGLTKRLAQTHSSLRDMEDDMARLYREIYRRGESKDINNTVLHSNQTTVEMDKLLQSCELWQDKLALWSRELAKKVEKVEMHEVKNVLKDIVTKVEMDTLQDQLKIKQMKLQWAVWLKDDAAKCLKKLYKDIQDTDVFEAQKQLMDDRVVETQLAQKQAVEKEMELSLLRVDQEQLMQSSCVVPNEELEAIVAAKEAMEAELKQLKDKVKQQMQELLCVNEERASLRLDNQKLVEEARQLHEKQETEKLQNVKQEEEIKKLHAVLQAAKTREATVLERAGKVMEKNKQCKEELKIVYTKFSSAMDSVSAKTVRLEELEQELKDSQGIRNQNEQLQKQLAQLQQEKAELSAARHREKDDMSEELVIAQRQLTQFKELASQQKELASKLQSEVTELKGQNEALRKQEHQSVGQPSKEWDKRNTGIDSDLLAQVAEKEALQMFVQRYYSVAEEKCTRLLEKVSKSELQLQRSQEQTKESCSLLRMCAQVDTCDESVRASLLDVIATLEGLT